VTDDNIIYVSLCPSCQNTAMMRPFGTQKNVFYCSKCKSRYKQHINGKIVYIPLHVSEIIEETVRRHYDEDPDAEFVIDFEPEDPS